MPQKRIKQILCEKGQNQPDDDKMKNLVRKLDKEIRKDMRKMRQIHSREGKDYFCKEEKCIIRKLARKRKALGHTQADIAERMGTKKAAISRLESTSGKNRHSPSLSTLIKYVDALGYRLQIKLVSKYK